MFGIPDVEILLIAVVALILFGNKLPTMMRSLGKSLSQFKQGMDNMREQVKKGMEESDHEKPEPPQAH